MAHLVLFCLPVGLLLLLACSNSKGGKVVQAVNDGKCNGTYEGVFPAADCPGIYMMLVVNGNQYELLEKYIERSGTFVTRGVLEVKGDSLSLDNGLLLECKDDKLFSGDSFYIVTRCRKWRPRPKRLFTPTARFNGA
ncbi:copper resistance protein NlpE N-terminal domain-containing protein [Bacteroides graminisolvens]